MIWHLKTSGLEPPTTDGCPLYLVVALKPFTLIKSHFAAQSGVSPQYLTFCIPYPLFPVSLFSRPLIDWPWYIGISLFFNTKVMCWFFWGIQGTRCPQFVANVILFWPCALLSAFCQPCSFSSSSVFFDLIPLYFQDAALISTSIFDHAEGTSLGRFYALWAWPITTLPPSVRMRRGKGSIDSVCSWASFDCSCAKPGKHSIHVCLKNL